LFFRPKSVKLKRLSVAPHPTRMNMRRVVSMILVFLGLTILIGNFVFWIATSRSPLNPTLAIILGTLLLVAGALILITEMLESWLSHGQAALVDGLQAG
jgi:polyferredoxin